MPSHFISLAGGLSHQIKNGGEKNMARKIKIMHQISISTQLSSSNRVF